MYKTKDYLVAALLLERGQKLGGTNWEGKVCWWLFANEDEAMAIIKKHYNRELSVNSKSLFDSLRTIKSMLY